MINDRNSNKKGNVMESEQPAAQQQPATYKASYKAKLPSAFTLFKKSSKLVQDNIGLFALVNALSILSAVVAIANRPGANDASWAGSGAFNLPGYAIAGVVGFGFLVVIVFLVLSAFLAAMAAILQYDVAQGKKPTFDSLVSTAKNYWLRLLGLNILVGLMIVVGLFLFIVPGLIVLRRYYLSQYYLIDKDLSISDALKQSADMSKPFSGAIWGLIGVTFLLGLSGAIPVIGSLISVILGILYSVAPALRYQEIKTASAHAPKTVPAAN
jgi:uncharacterized membrane protein